MPAAAAPATDRSVLVTRAFRLEYASIGWMLIEAVVAISAAVAAHSLALLAFGIDSVIELVSAGVLIWRLQIELRHGRQVAETAERRAARIGGALLFALALYVVASAAWKLWTGQGAAFSWPGLIVTALAIPVMATLAWRKLRTARALGSAALRADAVESLTCGWLSLVVVIALAVQAFVDAWWIDPVASLVIVWYLVREGREAWNGEACCDAD